MKCRYELVCPDYYHCCWSCYHCKHYPSNGDCWYECMGDDKLTDSLPGICKNRDWMPRKWEASNE
jgi:hypothetical protein